MAGLVERHDDSLNLLCSHLGAFPPDIASVLNRSRSQTRWDAHAPETRRRAEELVGDDQELYRWAEARFTAAMAEMLEALRPEIPAHLGATEIPTTEQVRAVLRDRFFRNQADAPLSEEIDYTFDKPLIGEGWYERQPEGPGDSLFGYLRGIVGDACRATLYLPIARHRPCILRFGVARIYAPEAAKGLRITVNGVPIALHADGSGHPRLLSEMAFRADVPVEALRKSENLTQIAFLPGGSIVPADRDPFARDRSALTLALNWVSTKSVR
jgi:hypothetical protein